MNTKNHVHKQCYLTKIYVRYVIQNARNTTIVVLHGSLFVCGSELRNTNIYNKYIEPRWIKYIFIKIEYSNDLTM